MEKEVIYKDFDLPTKHLVTERHFVPAKARDEDEIERRRGLRSGVLLAEHQERGVAVAASILKRLHQPEDVAFASRIISAAGLNTAWYSFARGAEHEVMRRRLKLPFLAAHAPEFRPSSDELLYDAAFFFDEARQTAEGLVDIIGLDARKEERLRKQFGKQVGKASLTLACVSLGDELQANPLSSVDTQNRVRQRCLQTLDNSRTIDETIGLPPSIAQFTEHDSHLSVYWRREAPSGAQQAYQQAVNQHLAA